MEVHSITRIVSVRSLKFDGPLHYRGGWPGILKTIVFTMLMLAISTIITKRKIRLKL